MFQNLQMLENAGLLAGHFKKKKNKQQKHQEITKPFRLPLAGRHWLFNFLLNKVGTQRVHFPLLPPFCSFWL